MGLQLQELYTNFNEVCKIPAYIREFGKPKGRYDGCFCDVVRMHCNLIVCFHQIYCGEDSPASRLCKIGNVPNGILVGDGRSERSVHNCCHRVPSRLLSWGRGGRAKHSGYPTGERCSFGASPRTRISQFGGGLVLAAVGAKLQVVEAWCEDINRLKPAYVLHVNTEFASPPAILSRITTRSGRRVRFPDYWGCSGLGGGGGVEATD